MRSRHRRTAVLAAAIVLCGCDIEEIVSAERYQEDFHHSYELKSGGRLSLEGFNGGVEITAWDREEVDISGTKYASTEESLAALKVAIDASADAVRIRASRPTGHRGNMGVSFKIQVPRRVELELIESSNGSIRVDGVEGEARLRTSNGRVYVEQFEGDLNATSSNGSVELVETRGSAVLKTSNGRINADGVRGYFEAATSNGSITARVTEMSGDRPMRVGTSNGRVQLTLEKTPTNDVVATSSNGSITVRAPADLAARVRAVTSNASVRSDFDVLVSAGTTTKSRLEGTVNEGGPLLDLRTSNAGLTIERM